MYLPEYHRDGTKGGFIRRFSCRVCIFVSDHCRCQIRQYDREDFDLVSELEQKTGFIVTPYSSLIQMISAHHSDKTERRSVGVISVGDCAWLLSHAGSECKLQNDNAATTVDFDWHSQGHGDRQSAGCYSAMRVLFVR